MNCFSIQLIWTQLVNVSKENLPLKGNGQKNCYETKNLKILYDYILNTSKDNETIELYTAWNSEEDFLFLNKTELLI